MAKKTESPEQPEVLQEVNKIIITDTEGSEQPEVLQVNPEQVAKTESPEQPEVLQPNLLEETASPELAISTDLVTVENELGVRHKVSAIAAKSLLSNKNIKIVPNG